VTKRRRPRTDDGFTLIELLVSLAVISTVLSAVTMFFVRTMATVDLDGSRQTAVQIAADGLEKLRAVPGTQAGTWLSGNASAAVVRDGVTFTRTFTSATDPAVPSSLDVTVRVTWRAAACGANPCSYAATTLVSTSGVQPLFTQAP
jgi:prepilin-type N-terminal cleavage/methylation domain-containing protein